MSELPRVATADPDNVSDSFLSDFAERWLEVYNAHDVHGVLAMCTPDIRWEDPSLVRAGAGHADVRHFLETIWTAFPDLLFTNPGPALRSADGTSAAIPWAAIGSMRGALVPPGLAATGNRVEFAGIDLWSFRHGKLCRYSAFYDTAQVARAIGALPERESAAERMLVWAQRIGVRMRLK